MFTSNLRPLWPYIENLVRTEERSLRLSRMRGRLEVTVQPYVESSYLLASDTPTKRLTSKQQARS